MRLWFSALFPTSTKKSRRRQHFISSQHRCMRYSSRMSNHDLTQGPVSASLARLTAPMMVGVSSSILVQVLELGFIGQLSTAHVAAITFTFPLVMVLTSIALGISIGTSSVIARSVGNRQKNRAESAENSPLRLLCRPMKWQCWGLTA